MSFIALVLGLILLPETRQFGAASPTGRKPPRLSALRAALGTSSIGPVVLAFFMATLGFAAFETTLALFMQGTLNFPPKRSYLLFAYIGLVLMLTQGLLYRRLAKRVSEPTFMVVGILFMALGLLELGAVTVLAENEYATGSGAMALVLAGLACAVMGFAFMTPSAQALISRRTEADRQGEILGVNQSAAAMARILGPLIGITLFKLNPLWPYAFGAGLLVLMLPLMPRVRRG